VSGACAHCELPLARSRVAGTIDGVHRRFCCYGCLLAFQITRTGGEGGVAASILVRLGVAVFFAVNLMMVSMPVYVPYVYGADAGDGPLFLVLRVLAAILAAPVLLLLGAPILLSALAGVRRGEASADVLIIVGTFAAYGLSAANVLAGRSEVYFDTAAMLLVLVTLGRYLEASAKAEAGKSVRAQLAPAPAVATRLEGMRAVRVNPATLVPDDVVVVSAGDAFPTDGVVVAGVGGVDEAMLTGESRPVAKEPGATVAGGSCSIDGVFRVRVTAPAAASAAARVAALMAAARRERAPVERLADRAARVLMPATLAIAAGALVYWTAEAGLDRGILAALSVLVVACPCAFGIATPVALWTGLAAAARRGVIIRSAPAIERAAHVERVFFDKTGTLTTRTPHLQAIDVATGETPASVLGLAAALESGLAHPLAHAVDAAAREREVVPPLASDVRLIPGRGVAGRVQDQAVTIGSRRLAAVSLSDPRTLGPAPARDATEVFVLRSGRLAGRLCFVETARPEAARALAALRGLGMQVGMLSGDGAAAAIVPSLVPAADAALGLLPADKVARVRGARAAMVGDGINDAPALAAADLGVAVGSAADVARMSADVAILGDDLTRVPWLLAHARKTMRIVQQNLGWAIGYNAVAVALAAHGSLNPLVAALAMLASSFAVVANARRLRVSAWARGDARPAAPLRAAALSQNLESVQVELAGFGGGSS
jgi:heavy metal translocating P-type ATPase